MAVLRLVDGSRGPGPSPVAEQLPAAFDAFAFGSCFTKHVTDVDVAPLLCDLAATLADLLLRRTTRGSVGCYGCDGAWEIGLERSGERVLVSLFRSGKDPDVAVFERDVGLHALVHATLGAMDRFGGGDGAQADEVRRAKAKLEQTPIAPVDGPRAVSFVNVESEGETVVRIGAELGLRALGPRSSAKRELERADLFGLLSRGTIRIGVGDRTRTFADRFVFLFAEQLLALAGDALGAWEQGQGYHRRVDLAGVVLGIRFEAGAHEGKDDEVETGPPLWLTLHERTAVKGGEARTFRLPNTRAFVDACVQFARALARAFLRHDPAQKQNLRLTAFRRSLRALEERLRDAERDDAKVNASPEPYRAFASTPPGPAFREAGKLAFAPAWSASLTGIDLRATFLCGDHLIVGASRETACVDRRTGQFLWRRPTQPAVSVVTTLGLARIFADGSISVHDFGSGDVLLTTKLAPRAGGVITGAVVSSPGLPRLLVVSEGNKHLSAVDLSSGDVRWRHTARGGSLFRLRRAGKLLIVAAGDATLTALDVASGEMVWRARDKLRFSSHVGLDHESLFAVAGGATDGGLRGPARLYHLDPYAGITRWSRDLSPAARPLGAPLVTDRHVVLMIGDRRGLGLFALDRASGEPSWSIETGLLSIASAWLAVDDSIIINGETGELVSVGTREGQVRWRQRFAAGMEGDQPRRLEPILRSGALFVPQQQVHVVRPRDGALLGCVPTELIPDLLRVDERCDVYVAEESGHVAAFRAGARLRVI